MSLLLSHSSTPHYTSETVLTQITNDFSTNVPNSLFQPSKHLTARKQTLLTTLLFPGFWILHCSGSPLTSQTTSSQKSLISLFFFCLPKGWQFPRISFQTSFQATDLCSQPSARYLHLGISHISKWNPLPSSSNLLPCYILHFSEQTQTSSCRPQSSVSLHSLSFQNLSPQPFNTFLVLLKPLYSWSPDWYLRG